MNERELSRRISTSVVDTLKTQGHVLVVKGGAQALARELEELMTPTLHGVTPRLLRGVIMGEVTSTFGDDAIDEAIEALVARMTKSLMDSDHVEDVFAEDNVIRRDVFRTVRDGIQRAQEADVASDEAEVEEETELVVRLDTLGYVAATVSKRADPEALREALETAAALVEAELTAFVPETREATFHMADAGPDGRLDLEESVADELTTLVEQGIVELPTIERLIDVGVNVSPAEQKKSLPAIEGIAEKTLHRSGCAASWSFSDGRTIRVTLTPLSEQDSREVDHPVALFGRGVAALFSAPAAAPSAPALKEAVPASKKAPASERAVVGERAPAPSSEKPRSSRKNGAAAPGSKKSPALAAPPSSEAPSKRPVSKKTAAKAPSKAVAKTAAKGSKTKPATKAGGAKKASAKKR